MNRIRLVEPPPLPRFQPPIEAALDFGWPICEVCEHGILPGERVSFRGLDYHAACAARVVYFLSNGRVSAGADRHWLAAHGELIRLHVEKSSTYGSDGDRFANFTAVAETTGASPERYVLERILEKLTRALNMIDSGLADDVVEYPDIASLGLCAEALQRRRLEAAREAAA